MNNNNLEIQDRREKGSGYNRTVILLSVFICLLILLGVSSGARAQEINPRFQSVFILGVSKHIKWTSDNLNFRIAVIGRDNKLLAELKEVAGSKQMNGKQVQVQSFVALPGSLGHDIVFVTGSDPAKLKEVLKKAGKNTMVMSAYSGALKDGSHLNFFMNGNKISFELNKSGLESQTSLVALEALSKLAASVQ